MNETSRLLKIIEENDMTYGEFAKRIGASLGSVKRWRADDSNRYRECKKNMRRVQHLCGLANIRSW